MHSNIYVSHPDNKVHLYPEKKRDFSVTKYSQRLPFGIRFTQTSF